MASNDLLECGICKEGYNEEEHKPIILPCSHSFCKNCIDGFIYYGKLECPVCRKSFHARSSMDLPMNRGMLDTIKYIKQLEAKQPILELPYEGWQAPQWKNAAELQKTKVEIKKLIQVDETLIKDVQKFNRIVKEIVENNEKFVDGLTEHKEKLKNQLISFLEKEKELNKTEIEYKNAGNFTAAGPIMDEISSITKQLWKIIRETKLAIDSNHALLKTIGKNNKESQSKLGCIQEIANSLKILDDGAKMQYNIVEDGQTKQEALIYLTVEEFWKASGTVYLVKSENKEKRYIRIRKNSGKVPMTASYLKKEQTPPATAKIVKHEYLKELFNTQYPPTYMELSCHGEILGKIVIKYENQTYYKNHVTNHIMLCSGELGPSFINSSVLTVKNAGDSNEVIVFGDYEKNDGSGGKAVWVPSSFERWWTYRSNANHRVACSNALGLFGSTFETASQFCIMPHKATKPCFGQVVGIDILMKALQKYENPREIKVSDCGLLIYPTATEGKRI